MTYDYTNNLRLEVEVPTEGLPNIVKNPSGEKGTSGYETPLANQSIETVAVTTAPGRLLRFSATAGGAATAYTSPLPATPGMYYAARYDVPVISTGGTTRRARFEFLDGTRTLISQGPQTALVAPAGTHYVPAAVAPAGTAFVRLRWDFYTSTGATPTGAHTSHFNKVMVTYASTNAGLGSVRTNLVKNPSLETNTATWDTRNGGDTTGSENIARTANGNIGTYALRLWRSDAGTGTSLGFKTAAGSYYPVRGSGTYTFSVNIRGVQATSGTQVIYWYDSNGISLGAAIQDQTVPTAFGRRAMTATAPSGARYAGVGFNVADAPQGVFYYFDGFLLEDSKEAGTYFDGTTTSTSELTYAWSGTSHQSASTATATGAAFEYSEPNDWLNVLGPAHHITIEQSALDRGSLTAGILDPLLDPASVGTIRPGKQIRLQVLVNGSWESRFEGKIVNAPVAYNQEKRAGSNIITRITITADDCINELSNQVESRGVPDVKSLPGILEGKGVAFNCNNKTGQVANPQVVSYNENATILDQIAVTRDSVLGYAWVDRNNVVNVFDAATMPTNIVATFGDTTGMSYTGIDVDFNVESCINQVTVSWLRYDVGTGSTTEAPYGPWVNAESQATWGPRSATFTIHGATEDPAVIAQYAQTVLNRNAVPVVRCNGLTFRVKDEQYLSTAATLNLYDLVDVDYDTKIDSAYRVTGMTHSITPQAWDVSLSFEVAGSVAAPTAVPSPPFSGVSIGTAQAGFVQMFAGVSSAVPEGWLLCNGSTFSASTYPDLYAVLGNSNVLPDLRGRFPIGVGTFAALKDNDGATESVRSPRHRHTIPDQTMNQGTNTTIGGTGNRLNGPVTHNHGGNTGYAGDDGTNAIPYYGLHFIIKA